jgi:exodeoxyribonuclease-5
MTPLPDQPARLRALTDHGATLLVEAGAGSGKTAILAGRVVLMLAAGVAPRAIAAITFTELAAGQLFTRISEYLDELLAGNVPPELAAALPAGLSAAQRRALEAARECIGELTVSTIHGFARALIGPYPVESGMDPGARVMDEAETDLAWRDLFREFLREALDGHDTGSALAAFVLAKGREAHKPLEELAAELIAHRTAQPAAGGFDVALLASFDAAVGRFTAWLSGVGLVEESTARLAEDLRALAGDYAPLRDPAANWRATMRLALAPPVRELTHTKERTWRKWGRHGKWEKTAGAHGRSKTEGRTISDEGEAIYQQVAERWLALHQALDAAAFAALAAEFRPLLDRYAAYKRDAALLDFEDLLLGARALVCDHEPVRQALAARFRHVLVDEFQDTDPLQAEILWRLCGEGPADRPWIERALRPGALFCVGDPKQAIYRFRGADVDTYVQAREAIRRQQPQSVLEITANFRSVGPILAWVNQRFRAPLAAEGQPGFQDLAAVRAPRDHHPCVVRLDVPVTPRGEQPDINDTRECEAAAVAALCRRLIGSHEVEVRGVRRPARPGDIALLAPTGTQLWRYERALESLGIPVASQAGKGFFRRQEIQDLIALTRVLADSRDSVALGALLRGPLVGLTEEELLDIAEGLPAPEENQRTARLRIWTPTEQVTHPLARHALQVLQGLARRARSTTPFSLLAAAVEELRVRPLIVLRHPGGAELARPYDGRGLQVFAADMRARWEDAESQIEGRPDAEEQAVQLITMHSAKGLEWPIVIPVNTCGAPRALSGILHERRRDELHHKVGPIASAGYERARAEEEAQLQRERQRLLYVACTRAAELLVVPNPIDGERAWLELVDLGLDALPAADFTHLSEALPPRPGEHRNGQPPGGFAAEAARIAEATRRLSWQQPSRHEAGEPAAESLRPAGEAYMAEDWERLAIRGGPARGRVMHKLLEEILTQELTDDAPAVEARARELLLQLGEAPVEDPAQGFAPAEIAATALRALGTPEIARLRERLVPELPVYGHEPGAAGTPDTAIAGIADAVALAADGTIAAVIDWKSDVAPGPAQIERYRAQLRDYQAVTGAGEAVLVLGTVGKAI